MKYFHKNLHIVLALSAAALLLIFVERLPPETQTEDKNSRQSVSVTKLRPIHPDPKFSKPKAAKTAHAGDVSQSPSSLLKRFDEIKGKVLLNNEETNEKEQLLSDPKIIDWVSSRLTKGTAKTDLKDRLSLIDYLEEAVTWKDNPNRDNALTAISNVILSENFLDASREVKRQLVGDKIELFTILSEEASEKATELKTHVQGTKIEAILNYAERRLPVKPLQTGGKQ